MTVTRSRIYKTTTMLGFSLVICFGIAGALFGQTKKAGQESCDGALDVVPAKAMSFTRKRRPANTPPPNVAQPTPMPRKKTGK